MAASDVSRQLRLLLSNATEGPSLPNLLQTVDSFVAECSVNLDNHEPVLQLEEELLAIYHELIDHSVLPQVKAFLSVLYHIRPILSPLSIISTWFDLVLRPALREPKLAVEAVTHAKELIVLALDPTHRPDEATSPTSEKDKKTEKVKEFRRRLMDLYLLDAYNESSGDDALEWAELDDTQKERKACWKANLEDVLVRIGLQRPQVGLVLSVQRCLRLHAKQMSRLGSTHRTSPLLLVAIIPPAVTSSA